MGGSCWTLTEGNGLESAQNREACGARAEVIVDRIGERPQWPCAEPGICDGCAEVSSCLHRLMSVYSEAHTPGSSAPAPCLGHPVCSGRGMIPVATLEEPSRVPDSPCQQRIKPSALVGLLTYCGKGVPSNPPTITQTAGHSSLQQGRRSHNSLMLATEQTSALRKWQQESKYSGRRQRTRALVSHNPKWQFWLHQSLADDSG